MSNSKQDIQAIQENALALIRFAKTLADLEAVRVAIMGRKSELTAASKMLGTLPPEERAHVGQLLNQVKSIVAKSIEERQRSLSALELQQQLQAEWLDPTLPPSGLQFGHIHPVSQIQQEIEDLFTSMGFQIMDGPEVETEHYNFDALNIPPDHPARDMQDTFWLTDGHLLRTHTSPVQVRALEQFGAPIRMIAPGRVFRQEEVDASHEHTFYQLEGMMVDRDVSVGHLIYFMQTLLSSVFKRTTSVRLRPGYFPFVEPGFELDIQCLICGGKGCPVCKQSGWVELLPCGLVHPNVLSGAGLNPKEWNGFAFGLGLTRLAMMRYAIDDIRLMQSGDLRFLNQF